MTQRQQQGQIRQARRESPQHIDVEKGLYINLLRFLEIKHDQRVVRKWNSFYGETHYQKVAYLKSPEVVVLFLQDIRSRRVNQLEVKIQDIEVPSPPPRIEVPREHYRTVFRYVAHLAGAIYRRSNKFFAERDGLLVAEILSPEMLGVVVERARGLFGKTLMQEISIPFLAKAYRVFRSYCDIGQTGFTEGEIDYLLGSWGNDVCRKSRKTPRSSRHKQWVNGILSSLPIFTGKNIFPEKVVLGYSIIQVASIKINGEVLTTEERREVMAKLEIETAPWSESNGLGQPVQMRHENFGMQSRQAEPQIVRIPFQGMVSISNTRVAKMRDRILAAEDAERTPPPETSY